MPVDSAKAIWEIVAGIIPGIPDPQHTRRFGITSGEWYAEGANQQLLLLQRFHEAVAYATDLQIQCAAGYAVNWVRIEFVWP